MITREQVADLQPGDVVEIRDEQWAEGSVIRGPLQEDNRHLMLCCAVTIRHPDGSPGQGRRTLTVVSRAPRPLYVNSDRTEPVPGDVVRDADGEADRRTWTRNSESFSFEWLDSSAHLYVPREKLPRRLRLLVDGETGQVVP